MRSFLRLRCACQDLDVDPQAERRCGGSAQKNGEDRFCDLHNGYSPLYCNVNVGLKIFRALVESRSGPTSFMAPLISAFVALSCVSRRA